MHTPSRCYHSITTGGWKKNSSELFARFHFFHRQRGTSDTQASTRLNRYQTEIARTEPCRTLCNKTRATLPREVRDMIYEYVIEVQNVAVDTSAYSSATLKLDRPSAEPRDCACSACTEFFSALDAGTLTPRDRHSGFLYFLRDEEHFGAEVQAEIAKTYYRVTTFTVHQHRTIFTLGDKETWLFDRDPREAMRKLDVFMGQDYLSYLLLHAAPDDVPVSAHALWPNIEELRNFGKNCHITIHITAWPRYDRSFSSLVFGMYRITYQALGEALDTLFWAFKGLRADGWEVSVLPGSGVVGQADVAAFRGMDLEAEKWIDKVRELRLANYGTL